MSEHSPSASNHSERSTIFPGWGTDLDLTDADRPLPSHHEDCLGCGRANPHGHHLVVHRDGEDAVTAVHTFDERHVGAPGIAHGGAVATVLDDLFGFTLYLVNELAVTRSLSVEYVRPVRLGTAYQLRAHVGHREGRKLHLEATLTDALGQLVVRSEALFLVVDVEHFHLLVPRP